MTILRKMYTALFRFEGLEFYRCQMCGTVVSVWNVREDHGCPKCACVRIMPTKLGFWEAIKQFIQHPDFWNWPDQVL